MNSVGFFEIQATDVVAAVAFYKTVFGWRFTKQEGWPIEYYEIETEGIRGGLLQRPVPAPPLGGTNAYICSMQVTDFDKTSELIMANGGRVAMAKFAVPGRCWQGYFIDAETTHSASFRQMKMHDENLGDKQF